MDTQAGLRFTLVSANNNTAGAKVASAIFGATTVLTSSQTTTTGAVQSTAVYNSGTLVNQVFPASLTTGSTTLTRATNNTATDLAVSFTGSIAVATDYLVIEVAQCEIVP
jgi:hypothetical protein